MSVTYSFSPGTTIASAEVNQNNADLSGKVIIMNLCGTGSISTTSTSYITSDFGQFPFVKTSNIDSIVFHAFLINLTAGTTYVQLYNITDASAVGSSELSLTSSTATWRSSGDIKAGFSTSSKYYGIQIKTSSGTESASCRCAYLVITYK